MHETNFTLSPIKKYFYLLLLYQFTFAQNRPKSDISGALGTIHYITLNAFAMALRDEIKCKKCFGVLEYSLLTEKILFQNRGLFFYYLRDPPPSSGLEKSQTFYGFFFRHPSLKTPDYINLYLSPFEKPCEKKIILNHPLTVVVVVIVSLRPRI